MRGTVRAATAVLAIMIVAGVGMLQAAPAAKGEALGPGQPHRVFALYCVVEQCGRVTMDGDTVGRVTFWPGFDPDHPQTPDYWVGETQYKIDGLWGIEQPDAFWSLWLRTDSHPEATRIASFNTPRNSPQKAFESIANTATLGYEEAEIFNEQLIVEIAFDYDDGDVGQGWVVARGTSPAP